MNIPDSECPVPVEQRPMNEYNSLSTSVFFFWTTKSIESYIQNMLLFSIPVYSLTDLLVRASMYKSELPLNGLLYTIAFGSVILGLSFLRIYLGWVYVYNRLIKASVSYEESGWYDGQTWIKSPTHIIQDKLIAKYQLIPIIRRIKASLLFFFSTCTLTLIYLNCFNS
jgi:hypothetical protein